MSVFFRFCIMDLTLEWNIDMQCPSTIAKWTRKMQRNTDYCSTPHTDGCTEAWESVMCIVEEVKSKNGCFYHFGSITCNNQ